VVIAVFSTVICNRWPSPEKETEESPRERASAPSDSPCRHPLSALTPAGGGATAEVAMPSGADCDCGNCGNSLILAIS
jgi:hypothetical protein